ncbi:MAG: LLM class flavin-dependent oxidoreductase, partial [Nocardioides sp.]
MNLKLHWFLPTTGDARGLVGGGHSVPQGIGRPGGDHDANVFREATIDYLASIARAADQLGFESVLTPTGTWCEDAWLVTAALIRETRRLKFLVAFRPGVTSPTLSAQMAAA